MNPPKRTLATFTALLLALGSFAQAQTYSTLVLGDSPISYYRFSGNVNDSAAGNNDAVSNDMPFSSSSPFVTNGGDNLGQFVADTSTTSASLGAADAGSSLIQDLSGAPAITIEGWIDFDSVSTSGAIFGYEQAGTPSPNTILQLRATPNLIRIAARSEDTDAFHESNLFDNTATTAGKKHFALIADFANDEFRTYINANLEETITSVGFSSSTFTPTPDGNPITIGTGPVGNIAADFDELAVYNRALTQAEITAHFNAVPEPSTAMLLIGTLGMLVLRRRRS